MDFLQLDVFADGPYGGNPLAVYPDAASLTEDQMQSIAREMNLSETTFVVEIDESGYTVRIFTPDQELPFAGHPTIGTTWALRYLGKLEKETVVQRSRAGRTPVTKVGETLWFERYGTSESDMEDVVDIASAFGLEPAAIGFEWKGKALRPAYANAGVHQLMVPLKDVSTLQRCVPDASALARIGHEGAYCFAFGGDEGLRSRGFFPGFGVPEDPATGSACAALGLYLADRIGPIDVPVIQGVEMKRPSRIQLRSEPGRVSVGGTCHLVLKAHLEVLP